jgi:phenylalanyl-tRNA synthetase beta subunit
MENLVSKTHVNVRVRADGPTKVLELTEDRGNALSIDGTKSEESVVTDVDVEDEEIQPAEPIPAQEEPESTPQGRSFVFTINIDSVGISVIDNTPMELLYLFMKVC